MRIGSQALIQEKKQNENNNNNNNRNGIFYNTVTTRINKMKKTLTQSNIEALQDVASGKGVQFNSRELTAVIMHECGKSFVEIGEVLGVTRARAHNMVKNYYDRTALEAIEDEIYAEMEKELEKELTEGE